MRKTALTIALITAFSAMSANAGSDIEAPEAIDIGVDFPVPAKFSDIPGLVRAPDVLDLPAWVEDQTLMTWIHDEDTGSTIFGYVFDGDGNIVHPDYEGMQDLTLANLITDLFNAPGVTIPEEIAPDVEAALSSLTDEERERAVRSLIEGLRDVDGEEAFNEAVRGWLDAIHHDAVSIATEAEDADADTVDHIDWNPADVDGVSLLDAMKESFMITGESTDEAVRQVWVAIDPTCTLCLDPWQDLRDLEAAGGIGLNVVLVPAYNEDSFGTIAGILADEDPLSLIDGISEGEMPPFARFSDLSEETADLLRNNFRILADYNVPVIPLIAFEIGDEQKYLIGSPARETLDAELLAP